MSLMHSQLSGLRQKYPSQKDWENGNLLFPTILDGTVNSSQEPDCYYKSPVHQEMYESLRNQGMTDHQARDALALLGVIDEHKVLLDYLKEAIDGMTFKSKPRKLP